MRINIFLYEKQNTNNSMTKKQTNKKVDGNEENNENKNIQLSNKWF